MNGVEAEIGGEGIVKEEFSVEAAPGFWDLGAVQLAGFVKPPGIEIAKRYDAIARDEDEDDDEEDSRDEFPVLNLTKEHNQGCCKDEGGMRAFEEDEKSF